MEAIPNHAMRLVNAETLVTVMLETPKAIAIANATPITSCLFSREAIWQR